MRANPFNSHATRPGAIAYRYGAHLDDEANAIARQHAIELVVQTLRSVRFVQVIGPHGSGKSTLLADWAPSLDQAFPGGAWIQLTRDPQRRWIRFLPETWDLWRSVWHVQRKILRGGIFVIDGSEQLSPLMKMIVRFRAKCHGHVCLVTSHRPLSGFAIIHETTIDPVVVHELAVELLGDASHPLLNSFRDQPVDDVRQLWSRLYDQFANESQLNKNDLLLACSLRPGERPTKFKTPAGG